MTHEVNRLATPLPDSVLDRYYAANPDAVDHRKKADRPDPQITLDDRPDEQQEGSS